MKVIILAAGCGTRLLPYTKTIPKCMVKLANKPLLHHQIEVLHQAGLHDIIVVGGYRAEKISGKGIQMVLNHKFDKTNMVSTLFCAEKYMTEGEDLIITYGDIIYELKVLNALIKSEASIAVSIDKNWRNLWRIRMEDLLSDAETLKLKDDIFIEEIGKKPKNLEEIQGQYMGLIKVRGDTVQNFIRTWHELNKKDNYDGKNFENMYMTSFIQQLINYGVKVEAAFTKGGWLEVDSNSDLDLYNNLYKNNKLSQLIKL